MHSNTSTQTHCFSGRFPSPSTEASTRTSANSTSLMRDYCCPRRNCRRSFRTSPYCRITKVDHKRSFGEEEGDIITENGTAQPSRKLSMGIRHPRVPNQPDTEFISVTYPSMMVVMISIIQSRQQLLPSSSFHPVFGHFLDDIADENVPRETAIFPHLAAALSAGMTILI
ncbi:hypothetical protein PILCRDRAFT_689461 [Piloderma croceum F 1598]|uniref:Uncharacterized protein n=1 Tax=Piloderma croceum (strain F 1598) TaxID=765440 RepID=A0A0C3BCF1_PILCF|nr:hypothetical protein PILCRDRAFT_689461 [Piloderma croceum F 1598]